MPTWWPSTRSDGRVEGHSATDHRPHRGLERSAAVTAGEGRSTRNAGSFLLRPSRPWGRSARGQYLSSRCALEHAPGTVPFSGDDEERVPVSTSECACEAASVDFHGLLHLSAFLDAHASLVGDIRVPNGAAGIRADAFGEIANGWGGSHPVGVPVIVVSHTVPEGWPRPDRKVVFASGIEDALQQARKVAVDKTIAIGSPRITQQLLNRGVLDGVRISLVPVSLGSGVRFFDNLTATPLHVDGPMVVEGNGVTHLSYAVRH